jgi:hypothetical protein
MQELLQKSVGNGPILLSGLMKEKRYGAKKKPLEKIE